MKTTIYSLIALIFSGISFSQQKSITVGNQIWMTENLNVSTFRNGDPILEAKSINDLKKFKENKTPGWCYYNFDPENGKKYGKLYNKFALLDPRGLAPEGWSYPDIEDWGILVKALYNENDKVSIIDENSRKNLSIQTLKSMQGWEPTKQGIVCQNCYSWSREYKSKVACHICKDTRINGFKEESNNGNNATGFNALPGGEVAETLFQNEGLISAWWCIDKSRGAYDPEYNMANPPSAFIKQRGQTLLSERNRKENDYMKIRRDIDYMYIRCIKVIINENDQRIIEKMKVSLPELKTNFKIESVPNLISEINLLTNEKDKKTIFSKLVDLVNNEISIAFNQEKFDYCFQLNEIYKTIPNYNTGIYSYYESKLKPYIEYNNLVRLIKTLGSTSEEQKITGNWEFNDKRFLYQGKLYSLKETFDLKSNKQFTYTVKLFDAFNELVEIQEKNGYWMFENNSLDLYVEFKSEQLKKAERVNKKETIQFIELNEKEGERIYKIGETEIKLKGKKK